MSKTSKTHRWCYEYQCSLKFVLGSQRSRVENSILKGKKSRGLMFSSFMTQDKISDQHDIMRWVPKPWEYMEGYQIHNVKW